MSCGTCFSGGSCGNQGQTKSVLLPTSPTPADERVVQIKYVFTCSRYYDHQTGPMVVYQKNACNYDVVWPSMVSSSHAPGSLADSCCLQYGCPEDSVMQQLGLSGTEDGADGSGKRSHLTAVCRCPHLMCGMWQASRPSLRFC